MRKIFCEKISRRCYISRGWTGFDGEGVEAHTGGSGSVSEALAIDRLDTRISVHTPLFLPFWQKHSIIFALFGVAVRYAEFWGFVGGFWVSWVKNFAKNFFDASPCVSERVVKCDIGCGDFRVRN